MNIDPVSASSLVGGKAFHLYRLQAIVNVPVFSVITFDEYEEIQAPDVQMAIIAHCRSKGFTSMAVRSSATLEDSASHSFAGMFDSYLDVSLDGLISAIAGVLASLNSARVTSYCEAHSIDRSDLKMAVIIQRQLESRVSGVCITRNGDSDANNVVVEACFGVGELLVSGGMTPDRYVVERRTLSVIRETVSYQRVELQRHTLIDIPFFRRNMRKLSLGELHELVERSLLIETRLGFSAADIEWAYEGDTLLFLQARSFLGGLRLSLEGSTQL